VEFEHNWITCEAFFKSTVTTLKLQTKCAMVYNVNVAGVLFFPRKWYMSTVTHLGGPTGQGYEVDLLCIFWMRHSSCYRTARWTSDLASLLIWWLLISQVTHMMNVILRLQGSLCCPWLELWRNVSSSEKIEV